MTSTRTSGGERSRNSSVLELAGNSTSIRLLLQLRGPDSLRRHVFRAVSRVSILVTADVGVFLMMRAVVRYLRDDQVYGAAVASALRSVFPVGVLGGSHFVMALVLGMAVAGAYGRGDARRDVMRVAKGASLAVGLSLWTLIWEGPLAITILQGLLMLTLVWSVVSFERLSFDAFLRFVFQTPADGDPMVFVGDRNDVEARRIHDNLLGPHRARATSWVHLPQRGDAEKQSPTRIIERIHDALSVGRADTLVLCGEYDADIFEAVVESATSAGIRVLAVPRVSGVVQESHATVWYNGAPFVELTVPGIRGSQLIVKRTLDIVVSLLGLLLLSPLFALVAIAIKLNSRGPVFFTQDRAGYAGVVFRVLKFRTMSVDAEELKASLGHLNSSQDDRLFKIPKDPRVTSLGRFLRKWSIDELPQLVNVLSGEMSLVGPRPFFDSDLKTYLDHHFARLGAKPGITGLWQVKGRSTVTDFEEVVRLDREYVDRWSILLDLKILLLTIPAVLRGRGAY